MLVVSIEQASSIGNVSSVEFAAIGCYTCSLQCRANDYNSSFWNVSSVKRTGSDCYTCNVSSIELTTIPVALGTCRA